MSLAHEPTLTGRLRETLGMCANGKTMGPNEIPAEVLKLGIRENGTILRRFDEIIKVWRAEKAPQLWKDAVIKVIHRKKDRMECWVTTGAYYLLNIIANRLSDHLKRNNLLPEEQCGSGQKDQHAT